MIIAIRKTRSSAILRTIPMYGPANSAWGWIAAAVFVAIVLAVVFGMGRQPGQNGTSTASNETRAPATQMAPAPTNPATNPSPANPAPPVTPAPSNNAQ